MPREQSKIRKFLGLDREAMAILLMAAGSIISSAAYIYVNEKKYHPFTTVTMRGFFSLLTIYYISVRQNQDLTFASRGNFRILITNSVAVALTSLVYAGSQFYLSQPIAIAINSSSPIFCVIFDKLMFGVSLNKTQMYWLVVTFLGVLLVANGHQIYELFHTSQNLEESSFEYLSNDPTVILGVSILLFVFAGVNSYGLMLVKKLIFSSSLQIMYFQSLVMVILGAILLPIGLQDESFYRPDFFDIIKMGVLTCIPNCLGNLAINQALLMTKNFGLVTPFMFSCILSGYIISILRYGEEANIICVAGTVAIVLGVSFMMKSKSEDERMSVARISF